MDRPLDPVARFDFIAVYILTNHKRGTLYVGVTSDLPQRLWQHRSGQGSVFTGKYKLTRLVWFERHDLMTTARQRERRLKEWKIELIEKLNPDWEDIAYQML